MDDEDEKLISHKRLLVDVTKSWPQQIDGINDKAKTVLEGLIAKNNNLKDKVTVNNATAKYNSTDIDDSKVSYDITYDVTVDTNVKTEWGNFKEELESNNNKEFFDSFKNGNEDLSYGKCSVPSYMRKETPCSYGKSSYIFTTDSTDLEIKPKQNKIDNLNINFTISCSNNKKDGIVIVNNKATTDYSLCSVICKVDEDNELYREGYTSFTTKVTDIYPTYNAMGSSIPTSATSDKSISISLKMVYPEENNKPIGLKVKLGFKEVDQTNKKCQSVDDKIVEASGNFFKFENIRFNCSSDTTALINFELTFTDESQHIHGFGESVDSHTFTKKIKVLPKMKTIQDQTKGEGEYGNVDDLNNADKVQYMCGDELADVNGLCCERDIAKGESCTKMDVRFPFEGATEDMYLIILISNLTKIM